LTARSAAGYHHETLRAIRICTWPRSAALLLVALAVSAYTPPPLFRTDVNIQPEPICKTCHLGISEQWEQSAHSKSDSNQNLLWGRMYLYSLKQTRGKTFIACSPCHQPVTFLLQDFENLRPVSSEGVTCSYCHSIASAGAPEGIPPYTLDLGNFQSTIRNPTPTKAHGEAYSPYMATSEYCGGCHDYQNQNGVAIGTTLAEWKRTRYAKQGLTCQRCHMPGEPGRNSYLGPQRPRVADHSFDHNALEAARPGAATLKLRSERGAGDTLYATATNAGWGHSLPTGNDQNMALIRVRVLAANGAIVWENDPFQEWQVSIFALILADELGHWPAET
jgi:hypothetical protein